jgi:hypothetical protein
MMRLPSMFRRLDTTEADQAIARAETAQRGLLVRNRAVSMDVACGDPKAALARLFHHFRHRLFSVPEGLPDGWQGLLDKMP